MPQITSSNKVILGTVLERGKIIEQGISRFGGDKSPSWFTGVKYEDGTFGIVRGEGSDLAELFMESELAERVKNALEIPRMTGFENDLRDYIHFAFFEKDKEYTRVEMEVNLPWDAAPGEYGGTVSRRGKVTHLIRLWKKELEPVDVLPCGLHEYHKSFFVGNASEIVARQIGAKAKGPNWFIGNFMPEGSPQHQTDFESAYTEARRGFSKWGNGNPNASWVDNKTVSTFSFLLRGRLAVFFKDRTVIMEKPSDIVFYGPGVWHTWLVLEDETKWFSFRFPSVKGDAIPIPESDAPRDIADEVAKLLA